MKFTTALRSGSALRAAPVALLLILFYYFTDETRPPSSFDEFSPAIVAYPLMTLYPLAYAITVGLAIWESGRLRQAGVWDLAPGRSRYRVALNALIPVIGAGWLVIVTPSILSLLRADVIPSLDSMRLPVMALLVCLAYAVIGFAIGLKMKPVIAAPIAAVAVWIVIAFTRSVQPYWIRHVSGLFSDLVFGEVPSLLALTPPLLLAGGISLGLVVLWLPITRTSIRGAVALLTVVGGAGGAYAISHEWPHDPPLLVGRVEMRCVGEAPRVCMPEATASGAVSVQRDASAVLASFRSRGVAPLPSVITDSYAEGRFPPPSTKQTWHLNLTATSRSGGVRFQVATATARFPCVNVDLLRGHAAWYWAASVAGERKAYEARIRQEEETVETRRIERQVRVIVGDVLKKPNRQQAEWFSETIGAACGKET
ncbi:hypothetical protein AB0F07_23810 [Streptomyces fructofermentans]|uniref:hypothetical protein n=1 Tax=Streptomyces fructofermentans TaxID=152141 RepID=UPI003402A19F